MKIKHLYVLFVLNTFVLVGQPQKALFIGNSMTYYNNMPTMFKEIANEKGKNITTEQHTPGGTGFVDHYINTALYNLLKNNVWDYVILQPGTSESAGVSWPVNTTIQRGQKIIDSIKKYSPCAKVFLYEIPYGIKATNAIPDYNNYFNVQTTIKDSITKMAVGLQIPIIPAGECARTHLNNQQNLLLHNNYNDVHPNLNGSYLIACAMYSAIFQENVSPVNYINTVPQNIATYLQNITDQTVLPNANNWLINTYNLHSDFSYNVLNLNVSFTNLATNYDSVEWNFGDGTISVDTNPTHTYTTAGTKNVLLKAIKNGCEEIEIKQITVGTLNTPLFNNSTFKHYPNPATAKLKLSNVTPFSFKIINFLGITVYKDNNEKENYNIDISFLPSGTYIIVLNSGENFIFIKK